MKENNNNYYYNSKSYSSDNGNSWFVDEKLVPAYEYLSTYNNEVCGFWFSDDMCIPYCVVLLKSEEIDKGIQNGIPLKDIKRTYAQIEPIGDFKLDYGITVQDYAYILSEDEQREVRLGLEAGLSPETILNTYLKFTIVRDTKKNIDVGHKSIFSAEQMSVIRNAIGKIDDEKIKYLCSYEKVMYSGTEYIDKFYSDQIFGSHLMNQNCQYEMPIFTAEQMTALVDVLHELNLKDVKDFLTFSPRYGSIDFGSACNETPSDILEIKSILS